MLPDNRISSFYIDSDFVGPRGIPTESPLIDFEYGGIAIGDSSQGSKYQEWKCEVIERKQLVDTEGVKITEVWLSAENTAPFVIMEGNGITEVSITFDQNNQFYLAYVKDNIAYFKWFDTEIMTHSTMELGITVKNPRITKDDKRDTQSGTSDVILAYVRNRYLRMRMQRDRFGIEYTLHYTKYKLVKVGMAKNWRLQFMLSQ
jgi:hypothetical protein